MSSKTTVCGYYPLLPTLSSNDCGYRLNDINSTAAFRAISPPDTLFTINHCYCLSASECALPNINCGNIPGLPTGSSCHVTAYHASLMERHFPKGEIWSGRNDKGILPASNYIDSYEMLAIQTKYVLGD
jgi:hypothetical protein